MAELPPEMLTGSRTVDPDFDDDEWLFRRVRGEDFYDGTVAVDAVELPDMSVNREKYGPAEWLLLHEDFELWGVIKFRVRDIPPDREIWHEGVIAYTLAPQHRPLKYNYPHTEIWISREGVHIVRGDSNNPGNLHLLDPDFHLRWRECIVLASKIAIHPRA
jgi:hypothetical protein